MPDGRGGSGVARFSRYTVDVHMRTGFAQEKKKRQRFDFAEMKLGATNADARVRKTTFLAYFEQFKEFPSYLFDNEHGIDAMLRQTIDDMLADPALSKETRAGVESLVMRLSA